MNAQFPTNGQYMQWMIQHNGEIGAQMTEEMECANDRADLIKDLGDLKAELSDQKDNWKYGDLAKKFQDKIDKYQGTPYEDEVNELLGPMQKDLQSAAD